MRLFTAGLMFGLAAAAFAWQRAKEAGVEADDRLEGLRHALLAERAEKPQQKSKTMWD